MLDITTLLGRENCGFVIKVVLPVGKFAFVLAYNERNRITPWVTWCYGEHIGFNWGHYFNDEHEAILNVYERAYNEAQALCDYVREL